MAPLSLYLKSIETVHEEMAMFIIDNALKSATPRRLGITPRVNVVLIRSSVHDDAHGEYTVVVTDNGMGIPLDMDGTNLIPKAMVMGASSHTDEEDVVPRGYGASLVVEHALRTRVMSIGKNRQFTYADFSGSGVLRQLYPTPHTQQSIPGVTEPRNALSETGLIFAYSMQNTVEEIQRPSPEKFIESLMSALDVKYRTVVDFAILNTDADRGLIDCLWDDDPNVTYGAVRLMNLLHS